MRAWLAAATLAVLAGCASQPPAPDWSVNAAGHVERFRRAYLEGDEARAAREFRLARVEVARTGQVDQVALVELNRCAVQVAGLAFGPCPGFDALAEDATPAELAYARYLAGQASAADAALLPAPHRAIAAGGTDLDALAGDPLALLIAAAVLLQQERLPLVGVTQAVEAASHQGWRRPLLAWLDVAATLADKAGNAEEAARLRRRMDLVMPAPQ